MTGLLWFEVGRAKRAVRFKEDDPNEKEVRVARSEERSSDASRTQRDEAGEVMMEQLLAHLWGDFILQTDWMALNKKRPGLSGWVPCLLHAVSYACVFVLLTSSWRALLVICLTHAIIDHYDVVSRFIWERNWLSPKWISIEFEGMKRSNGRNLVWMVRNHSWSSCADNFGFSPSRPKYITFLLFVVIDNAVHLTINYAALKWF